MTLKVQQQDLRRLTLLKPTQILNIIPPKTMMLDISKQRLNYDKIAHLYDEPIQDYQVDPNLVQFLVERADTRFPVRVLDLGCGTGKQLTADSHSLSDLHFFGLDLFRGMLTVARKRGPAVCWLQGDSASPPFASKSFDYITNQFSYQHVQHQEKLFQEIYRLLKPDGRFVLNNIDPWHMREWVIYQLFPTSWDLDVVDFLPAERLAGLMKGAGFGRVEIKRQITITEMSLAKVYKYVSRRTATSQFMAISDEAYAVCLQRAEKAIRVRGEGATIQSTFCFLTIIADKNQA